MLNAEKIKPKTRKYSVVDKHLVVQHISALPKEESHYRRLKSNRKYSSQDLNINKLYLIFKAANATYDVSYQFYYTTFKNKFSKLSFYHPQTDKKIILNHNYS